MMLLTDQGHLHIVLLCIAIEGEREKCTALIYKLFMCPRQGLNTIVLSGLRNRALYPGCYRHMIAERRAQKL